MESEAVTHVSEELKELESAPGPELPPEPPRDREGLAERIDQGFERLEEALTGKLAYDRFKEQQIERLHAELQEYKKDLLARSLRPLLSRVIRLYGDLDRLLDGLRPPDGALPEPERCLQILEGFGDDLLILLEDQGAQSFEHPEPVFDPNRQTAVEVVDTEDYEADGNIARRIRPGFEYGAVLLQKERVAVYRAARNGS